VSPGFHPPGGVPTRIVTMRAARSAAAHSGGFAFDARRIQPNTREVSAMNVQPLADRILVRRIEEAETIRGGIIIPDTAKEKPQEGEVVAVGPGRMTEDGKRIAPEVKKGDRVLIGKYSGTDVKIEGTEYVILREDEVLGVLNK
jgi:chaperonin GroES